MDINKKYTSINLLKGLAIIMIIIVHNRHFILRNVLGLRLIINYCQMGVDLFFVISGFSVCILWSKKQYTSSIYSILDYLKKRYFRIAPGFILIILINFMLNFIFIDLLNYYPGFIMDRNPIGILLNALLLHGFSPTYINEVVPGGWYIGTAFILYMIFPFIYNLFNKINYRFQRIMFVLPIIFFVINFGLTYCLSTYFGDNYYPTNCTFMYYFFTNHLPAFSMGILLFFQEKQDFSLKCPRWISSLLGITFIFLSIYLYFQEDNGHFLFTWIPLICGIGFYWFTVFFMNLETNISFGNIKITRKSFVIDFLANCGKHSYGIFLMHSFISWYLFKAITVYLNGQNVPYNDLLLYFILLLPSIFLIYVLGYYFEKLIAQINKVFK